MFEMEDLLVNQPTKCIRNLKEGEFDGRGDKISQRAFNQKLKLFDLKVEQMEKWKTSGVSV